MTARRPTSADVAIAALAGTATYFTLLSWDGLSDGARDYLVPLFLVCAVVAASGLGLRAAGLPRWAVPVVQLLVVAVYVHHVWAVQSGLGGWLPSGTKLRGISDLLGTGVNAANEFPAPVPATQTGFAALMLGPGAALALLVDVVACTWRRPALAGLALLAGFTVPVALLGGVSWMTFALAALSFVLLLSAEQAVRLAPWGAPDKTSHATVVDDQPHRVGWSTLLPNAVRLGAVAIAAAVLTPALLPAADGLVPGTGDQGSGNGEVHLQNPIVDMRRDLTRGADVPLLRVRTDEPNPGYVRIAVLDTFDGTAWRPGTRAIPAANRTVGALPPVPGLDVTTPRTEHDWRFRVSDLFSSQWLPLPYPVSFVRATGDWRYDDSTLDVFSANHDVTSAGLRYRAVGLDVHPTSDQLTQAAGAPTRIVERDTALPDTLPASVEQLALRVTSDAQNQFDSAVELQDWFRHKGGFRYSLARAPGSGVDELLSFLGTGPGGRTGFCEQFATAMAVLARTLGIPARVAIGFLEPQRVGRDFVFSSHDLHSWPELYFQGTGWVRFEPTPAARTGAAPSYTRGATQAAPQPLPTASASSTRPGRPVPSARPDQATPTQTGHKSGGNNSWWWIGVAVAVLIVVALTAPRLVRAAVRRRRWSASDPDAVVEAAWAELRDTARDLGLDWDDRQTLRRRARGLLPALGVDPVRDEATRPVNALERLVLLLERARYSRRGAGADAPEARELTETVAGAMRETAGAPARRRADWLPASLWSRGSGRSEAGPPDESGQ